MAAPNPLAGLPSAGAFPVLFSSSFKAAAKGRQANKEEVYGLRYKFKPASITPSSKGEVEMDKGHSKLVHFDGQNGSHQTFDVHEEPVRGKGRECVLIWNQELAAFTITPLTTTMNLNLNRDLSAKPRVRAGKASPTTTTTTTTKRKSDSGPAPASAQEGARNKKSRPSELPPPPAPPAPAPVAPARPTKGGKGLPRKSIPMPKPVITPPSPAKGVSGKYKSSEIVENSDSDQDEDEDEDMDMEPVAIAPVQSTVSVSQNDQHEDEEEDDDGDEEEEEDGDDVMRAMLAESLAEPLDSSEEEESSDDDLC